MAIRRIGLTGGIGSGKSTVAGFWVTTGVVLIDTDAIARTLTVAGGQAIAPLRETFGDEVITREGALDREGMRRRAFADPQAKRRLEEILHPMIGAAALRQAADAGDAVVAFDIPLLTEDSVWRTRCDRIVVVDCTEQTQVDRVVRRSGWPPEQVRSVIAQQAPRAVRLSIADAVIHNDRVSFEQLKAHSESLLRLWAQQGKAEPSL